MIVVPPFSLIILFLFLQVIPIQFFPSSHRAENSMYIIIINMETYVVNINHFELFVSSFSNVNLR
ncbi:hypothetical protein K450DRAFT_231791 [Umbelopsis ramanniana AG]|uniref:Uncharacterized protein n=1 Tax=Umbelopsis ramanniana AG TaxID=1314678 RepID=A0AAD5HGV8_UMBRA|nr:uncharacterized protein K450DRAFT_231791 [Umbelopsis ramanniana AG]KAI8581538.1 hypothetical protein K450DRAFT_231791 [Umbelopsis ramanniana AG]